MSNIKIGLTIKNLRKQNNLTQEDLAEKLGVSIQTVSRWETGTNYPDISMLPDIARIFKTTIDILLGFDKKLTDEGWKDIYRQIQEYNKIGKNVECHKYLKEKLLEYPESTTLQLWYANLCNMIPSKDYLIEAIEIFEKVKLTTIDEGERHQAINGLFNSYHRLKNNEKMREIYEKHLKNYLGKDYYKMYFLEGNEKVEYMQQRMIECNQDLWHTIMMLRQQKDYYTTEEQIKLMKKVEEISKIIFEEEDYYTFNWHISSTNFKIFTRYCDLKDIDNAFIYLEKTVNYAVKHDTLPKTFDHKSVAINLLTGDLDHTMFTGCDEDHGNMCYDYLKDLSESKYDFLREDSRYQDITEKLKKYAIKY